MRFSAKSEYGILALFELALHSDGSPLQAKAIAQSQHIPPRFLEQVLSSLRKAGLIESVRGAQGGYHLARPPEEIRIIDVLESIDGPILSAGCVSDNGDTECEHEVLLGDCILKPIWQEVRSGVMAVLNSLTLADLRDRKREKDRQRSLMYHI